MSYIFFKNRRKDDKVLNLLITLGLSFLLLALTLYLQHKVPYSFYRWSDRVPARCIAYFSPQTPLPK